MNENTLKYCPSTLKEGFSSFSPLALRRLFQGKKVSHILPFTLAFELPEQAAMQYLSISGVQEKYGLTIDKKLLRLTRGGEKGQYILKPIPNNRLKLVQEIPANEHLTMQIAKQVYGIATAENTLVFFQDNQPAYLVKRFDYDLHGHKLQVEDFATLAGKSAQKGGSALKYEGSYEDMAMLVKQFCAASPIELERLFQQILFNYLFSNGDAHLKNFSLIETPNGDMVLSPAYDLLCTRLHVNDSDMAPQEGLFSLDYETASFRANAFYAYNDFFEFGLKIGLIEKRVEKLLSFFQQDYASTHQLIQNSFLSPDSQKQYTSLYFDKLKRLNYIFQE